MKKLKTALAVSVALTSAFAIAACGGKKKDNGIAKSQIDVVDTESIAAIPDGAEKELVWLSYFDINPTKKVPEKRTDLTLFEGKGGSIKWESCGSLEKYEKLASDIMADTPPDMFWYEQKMTFPANCVKGMFQPIDPVVDFDSPLWADTKTAADQYALNGHHFVAPIRFGALSVLTYDRDVMEQNNLDDPYELYLAGEWDWNTWYDMMDTYVHNGTADEERYGVNGWFAPFIFQSTGKTLIVYDEEKQEYVSNLDDPDFVRATDLLYNIKKNGMYYPGWIGQASDCFKENILFYAMGSWASIDSHSPKEGDNWGVVPFPKDPNSDTLYSTVEVNAYMWVNGSTKNDAMRCWLECARIVYVDDTYKQTERDKFNVSNPYWTDDMYDMAYNETTSNKYVQLVDPGYGISTMLSDDDAATNDTKEAIIPYMYTSVMKEDENGTQFTWTKLRETYSGTIDSELKDFNAAYKQYLAENP
ncbi:MAG: extracellular solute-binding protein [Ruminococcus sp.]|nr:extracellular solute-binding protein [Ruminococcus sp.]